MTRINLRMNMGMCSQELSILAPYYGSREAGSGMSREEFFSRGFKCVWLLHGLGGDCEDWVRYTQLEMWAEEKSVFVVCPSGGTDFYLDGAVSEKWETQITRDVWNYIHDLFPMISKKPEDNIIAGLSMGGFGAMYYGLRHPDKYGWVASLSGGLNIAQRYNEGENITGLMQRAFGPMDKVLGTQWDMYEQAHELKKSGRQIPHFYISCGTEDWEYEPNMAFRDYLRNEMGWNVIWDEEPGLSHEWRCWNKQIEKVLNWAIPDNFISGKFTRDHAED